MVTKEIKTLLKKAISELKIAEYELNRPNEDVVTVSVCLSARQSINSLLRLFLLSKSINHTDGKSLQELLAQCKNSDKQFESIDISTILCNALNHDECENKYCLTTESVTNCFSIANQVKRLVLNRLNLTESEIE